jgi:hypothetical protein
MRLLPKMPWALVIVVASISGCQKFTATRTVDMVSGGLHAITVDAPTQEQKVKVEVSSEGVAISVYVVLASNFEEVQQTLLNTKPVDTSKILVSEERKEDPVVQTKVPKGQDYVVILYNPPKRTQVTVKITGS